MPVPTITMYTDGACSGNPGPGGFAAILITGTPADGKALADKLRNTVPGHPVNQDGLTAKAICGPIDATTNNVAELRAILEGLQAIKRPSIVTIHTDSECAIGWLTRTFARKNAGIRDICSQIDAAMAAHSVTFQKVQGHGSNPLNRLADQYATYSIPRGQS